MVVVHVALATVSLYSTNASGLASPRLQPEFCYSVVCWILIDFAAWLIITVFFRCLFPLVANSSFWTFRHLENTLLLKRLRFSSFRLLFVRPVLCLIPECLVYKQRKSVLNIP